MNDAGQTDDENGDDACRVAYGDYFVDVRNWKAVGRRDSRGTTIMMRMPTVNVITAVSTAMIFWEQHVLRRHSRSRRHTVVVVGVAMTVAAVVVFSIGTVAPAAATDVAGATHPPHFRSLRFMRRRWPLADRDRAMWCGWGIRPGSAPLPVEGRISWGLCGIYSGRATRERKNCRECLLGSGFQSLRGVLSGRIKPRHAKARKL